MKKKKVIPVAAIVVAALLILCGLAYLYAYFLEIKEIGTAYTTVFLTNIAAAVEIFFICLIVSFAVFFINAIILRKNAFRACPELPSFLKRKYILAATLLLSILSGVLFSGGLYEKYLLFKNSVPSGISDPVFNFDISYFFFTREFLKSASSALFTILFCALLAVGVIYIGILAGYASEKPTVHDMLSDIRVFSHIAVSILLLCVLRGLTYYLDAQGVVLNQSSVASGALFTDVNIKLPFYTAAPYLIFVLVVVAAVLLFLKNFKGVIVTVLIFPALLLLMNASVYLVDLLYVSPNEITLEAEYIEDNIDYTLIGFGLDKTEVRTFPADESLTREILDDNSAIVNNIRITDPQATLEVLNSTKSIRNYYTFNDSDIVEYNINGAPTAVNISAREMDVTKLSGSADNYINRTLRYTHGYGIVMNPVNSVTSDGQPECIIQNMPITSTDGAPTVSEPRIYYGEKTNSYCIVNTTMDEFDYALNDENVESNYEGTASGIQMTALNRLIFAAKNADYTMLISGYINSESRLLPNRNVLQRVKKAVPFLTVDSDPYIVVGEDGRLYWIVDLYTTSDAMPYGTKYSGVSYIRNSAKAVVDAYEGTVEIYITDETDPIIMTYDSIYSDVLIKGGLPENIKEHIRYPEALFNLQCEVYLRYHMTDAETFYANSDIWMRAKEKYRGSDSINVEPYYNLMSVEDFSEENEQLVLMQPFVPANKENLVSWIAADNYGNIISYRFPVGRTVYGTLHIENKIDSDADISKELSLWDQGGSTVMRGNLLAIPIADSLIYVEPIYITTSNAANVPEVKRIIVAYGDKVVMRETLADCFDALFGESASAEETAPTVTPEISNEEISSAQSAAQNAIDAYDAARAAMTQGDFAAFGSAMDNLGKAIDTMRGDTE
ncbi:MAG: UPF0182 family protein [Clostridia bacterium]|nr:UPF0182 family protein [Clostridia bacterium]